jgi:glycosyltransferase involved in cell wall biosynthesis
MSGKTAQSARTPSFAVVIPMYNEELGAARCVRAVCAVLDRIPSRCALIVVEDGSGDRTFEVLRAAVGANPKLEIARHTRNSGYGRALLTGVRTAISEGYDYVLFMDSDLTNAPEDIPRFIPLMEQGVDVIKASRFVRGGRMQGVPWRRSIFSHAGNWIARAMFRVGIRDCTNGFRAVKVPILARMDLQESGFPIIVEELYQAKSLARTFSEVPVVLTSRTDDQRRTSFSYDWSTIGKYLRFALKACFGIRPDIKREKS